MHRKALVVFFRTHLPNAQDSRSENSAVCGDGVTMAIGHALAEPCHPKLLSLSIPKPRIPEPKTPTSLALASPTSIASWSCHMPLLGSRAGQACMPLHGRMMTYANMGSGAVAEWATALSEPRTLMHVLAAGL